VSGSLHEGVDAIAVGLEKLLGDSDPCGLELKEGEVVVTKRRSLK